MGCRTGGWSDENTVKLQTAAKGDKGNKTPMLVGESDTIGSGFRERRDPVEGRPSASGAPMVVIDKDARLGRHAAPGRG